LGAKVREQVTQGRPAAPPLTTGGGAKKGLHHALVEAIFTRQANIAAGPQQVNNTVTTAPAENLSKPDGAEAESPRARAEKSRPSKLLP
jgi:hypothetical protein